MPLATSTNTTQLRPELPGSNAGQLGQRIGRGSGATPTRLFGAWPPTTKSTAPQALYDSETLGPHSRSPRPDFSGMATNAGRRVAQSVKVLPR
jgi:hypothetical protein